MKLFERYDLVRFYVCIDKVHIDMRGRIRNLDAATQRFEVHCMDGRYRMVDVREVTLVAPPTAKR
jgi:hypothetical protein